MAEQKIQLINAISFAKGTTEPSNREVWWIDDNITGNVYNKLKYFNVDSGSWELVQRTAAQLLLDLKTVDGAGSGLDADTLDGYTAAELLQGEIKLSSGEILVGQLNDQAAAKTLSGIATIDINGALSYVANSISHTGLTDIGSNTHAQIDTHIADSTIHFTQASIDHTAIQNIGVNTHAQIDSHISSTANPHGVTAAQVGNTTAQWNANSIEGNLTNVGVLGAGQDGQALVWDNATSRFITAAVSSPSIYTSDDTIGSGRVATLTDSLDFIGSGSIGKMLGFTNDVLVASQNSPVIKIQTDLNNSGTFADIISYEWRDVSDSNNLKGHGFALGSKGETSQQRTIGLQIFWDTSRTIKTEYFLNGIISTGRGHFNFDGSDSDTNYGFDTGGDIVLRGSSTDTIGSEKISLQGRTLVQGADTLSTSTAFEIYDGDTVPSSLWDFRNNGDVVLGKDSTWTLGNNTLTFDGTGETGNVSVKIAGGNNHNAFQVRGLSDSDFFDLYSSGTSTLTMRGISTFKGANTAAGTSILKMIDSVSNSKFDVRCNGDIYTEGNLGLSATYTFGGGSTGDIASMTFTNGILTAVTTVP